MTSEQIEARLAEVAVSMSSLTDEYYSLKVKQEQLNMPADRQLSIMSNIRHDLVTTCGLTQYKAVGVASAIEHGEIRHVKIELPEIFG